MELLSDNRTTSRESIVELSYEGDMAIIKVKYQEDIFTKNGGDNELETVPTDNEVLVNIDCPIGLILDYVREVARLDKACQIDFCDEANCQLSNVSIVEPSTSGLCLLQQGVTYFIVTCARNSNNQVTSLIPLVSTKTGKRCMEALTKVGRKKSLKNDVIKQK